jgi:hypothetical protein
MKASDLLRWLGPGVFGSLMVAVVGMGAASWWRTAGFRIGRVPIARSPPLLDAPVRTSRATLIPGWAGVAALAWGGAGYGSPGTRLVLVLGGLLVAVSGFAARVVALEIGRDRLIIHYSRRPAFCLSWAEIRMLGAPRWPMGGWRVLGERRRRTLMPSDLLGREWALSAVVQRAGLRFIEGVWRRTSDEPAVSRGA